jgi:C-terminal processing protease CtpA/Prc
LISGKIIPNSPADQCGQLHINDRILAVNGVDLTHMLHTDVVNLIKDSGRTITLKIGPPLHYDDRSNEMSNPFSTNNLHSGIRPSSSSPMVIPNGNHPIMMTILKHHFLLMVDEFDSFQVYLKDYVKRHFE